MLCSDRSSLAQPVLMYALPKLAVPAGPSILQFPA